MEILVRAAGAVASLMVALVVVALVAQALAPKPAGRGPLPKGLHMAALAMEFVTDVGEVNAFLGAGDVGDPRSTRAALRRGLYGDYLFIAMYWLLFLLMSAVLAGRPARWAVWVGAAAAVCATATAVFDVVENLSMAALVGADEVTPRLVADVASAGFGKWLLFALTTLLLSPVFLRGGWLAALFALFLAVGLLCLAGLLGKRPLLVEIAFALTFAGLVPLALVFSLWPHRVVG